MSYCSKHRNHHCVHSHNCKDPAHKRKKQRSNQSLMLKKDVAHINNKKQTSPMHPTITTNQQCQFTFQPYHQSALSTEACLKKISSLSSQLQQSRRMLLGLSVENRQLRQKNSHVQCQMQYLRSQLDLLVNNHNVDISAEIKRNLAEHAQLNAQIAQLRDVLFDKEKLSEELSSENYSLQRKNKQLQATIKSYQDKFKLISTKNYQLSSSSTQSNSTIKQLENQLRSIKDKYATLALAAEKSTISAQHLSNQLIHTKEKLSKSIKSKQTQNNRLKQLHQLQKKTFQKIIQNLNQQVTKRSQLNKKIKQQCKKTQTQLSQLKDDHEHTKQMILKYQKMNSEFINTNRRIHSHEQDIRPQQKKTVPMRIDSRQTTNNLSIRLQQSQKQRQLLEQRVNQLQTLLGQKEGQKEGRVFKEISGNIKHQTVVVSEELVLSIGASEEFKRIVEQKNATIKKLMREKAELYNKIYLNHLHP